MKKRTIYEPRTADVSSDLDEALAETFPASDLPAIIQPGGGAVADPALAPSQSKRISAAMARKRRSGKGEAISR